MIENYSLYVASFRLQSNIHDIVLTGPTGSLPTLNKLKTEARYFQCWYQRFNDEVNYCKMITCLANARLFIS